MKNDEKRKKNEEIWIHTQNPRRFSGFTVVVTFFVKISSCSMRRSLQVVFRGFELSLPPQQVPSSSCATRKERKDRLLQQAFLEKVYSPSVPVLRWVASARIPLSRKATLGSQGHTAPWQARQGPIQQMPSCALDKVMISRFVHRFSAGPALQRNVRHQFHRIRNQMVSWIGWMHTGSIPAEALSRP